jgi:hypothetical protein
MVNNDAENSAWLPVIGRALAYISLNSAGLAEKTTTTAEKARFLESLGLVRKDVAAMLGTTPASVTELLRQAKNRKGKGRGKKG